MASELTPYQQDILIRTALGEARGEGVEGMADVIQVILNRANSGQFPSDPAKVALQKNQFSTWNKGEGGNNPQQFSANSPVYREAKRALEAVTSGSRPDPTGGALFYHTPAVKPSWSNSVNRNGTLERNGHVFYPTHPVPPGEIPSVATLLDTKRPAVAPNPASQSPVMTARRNATPSSRLIQDSLSRVASVNPRTASLGDQIAMAPIQGGRQTVAPFDAAFDTRTGQMRMTKEPYAGLGNDVATSKAPAPTPASVDDRINARNLSQQKPTGMAALSRAPVTYAAQDNNVMRRAPAPASVDDRLNARNLAQQQALLPEIPAASPVAPVAAPAVAQAAILPSAMTASDRARAAQVGIKPVPERLPSEPMMGARATAPAAQPGPWSVATLTDTVNPLTGLRTTTPAAAPVMARAAPNPVSRPVAAPVMRSPIAQVQPTFGRAPLQINVSGANIMRAPSVVGTSTGRLYTPGATVMLNGDRLTVNPNGSFTNERTGNDLRGSSSGGRSLVETADGMQWR